MLCLMTQSFASWLQGELDRRGWSVSDLAREANTYPATISNVLNGNRGIGREVAAKIAHALKLADAVVLYQAGFLERDPQDPTQELDPLALEILQMVANRPDAEQQAILATVKALVENFDRGKSEPTGRTGAAATGANKR